MLAFMQVLFRYVFLAQQDVPLALVDWQYGLLVLSTVLIAAAGYVVNNIFDIPSDTINKPKDVVVGRGISETRAYNIYIGLNITGVALGFYLSNVIMMPMFASLFIFIASLLFAITFLFSFNIFLLFKRDCKNNLNSRNHTCRY